MDIRNLVGVVVPVVVLRQGGQQLLITNHLHHLANMLCLLIMEHILHLRRHLRLHLIRLICILKEDLS